MILIILLFWTSIASAQIAAEPAELSSAEVYPKGARQGKNDFTLTIDKGATKVILAIDRSSFGTDATKQIFATLEESLDGGKTWTLLCGTNFPGGEILFTTMKGVPQVRTQSSISCTLKPVDSRDVRGSINVKTNTGKKEASGKYDAAKESDATITTAVTVATK